MVKMEKYGWNLKHLNLRDWNNEWSHHEKYEKVFHKKCMISLFRGERKLCVQGIKPDKGGRILDDWTAEMRMENGRSLIIQVCKRKNLMSYLEILNMSFFLSLSTLRNIIFRNKEEGVQNHTTNKKRNIAILEWRFQ